MTIYETRKGKKPRRANLRSDYYTLPVYITTQGVTMQFDGGRRETRKASLSSDQAT